MKIFISITAGLLITILLFGCNKPASLKIPDEADLAAINEFNRLYLKAINDGDIDSLENLTTDGHIMIASGRPPLVGKSANIDAMRRAFGMFEIDEAWAPVETVIDVDLAYQRGTFTVTATPKADGVSNTVTGNFLRIYRRQPDGSWRMVRDMFNTNPPPQQ